MDLNSFTENIQLFFFDITYTKNNINLFSNLFIFKNFVEIFQFCDMNY